MKDMLDPAIQAEEAGEIERLTKEAEKRIQRILLDLEEAAGWRIDQVRVDTRNFANCAVEIFLTARQRR